MLQERAKEQKSLINLKETVQEIIRRLENPKEPLPTGIGHYNWKIDVLLRNLSSTSLRIPKTLPCIISLGSQILKELKAELEIIEHRIYELEHIE